MSHLQLFTNLCILLISVTWFLWLCLVRKRMGSFAPHPLFYPALENSSYCKNTSVICVGNDNSCLACTCMYDLSIANVESYMT